MEILDDTILLDTLPDPKTLIAGFRNLTESRYLLIKRGKIFRMRTYRYFKFNNDYLIYYTTQFSDHIKGQIHLHKAIAIPFPSPIPKYSFCIKIISNSSSNFYIFCNDEDEQEMMMKYIKLASNNMLQIVLDKICFTALDKEYQILNEQKTPKALKIETFLTPKNAISRFLFSPTSDGNFDPPDESIFLKIPCLKIEEEKKLENESIEELITEKLNFVENTLPGLITFENGTIEEIRNLGVKYL